MHITVIKCGPVERPSRYERRRNLGHFDGCRLTAAGRPHDERQSPAKILLSFISLAAFIAAVACIAGGN